MGVVVNNVEADRLRGPAAWLMVATAAMNVLFGITRLLFGLSGYGEVSFAVRAQAILGGLASPVFVALLVGGVLLGSHFGPPVARLRLMTQVAVAALGLMTLFGAIGLIGGLFAGDDVMGLLEFLLLNVPALALAAVGLLHLLPRMSAAAPKARPAGFAEGSGLGAVGGLGGAQEQRPQERQYAPAQEQPVPAPPQAGPAGGRQDQPFQQGFPQNPAQQPDSPHAPQYGAPQAPQQAPQQGFQQQEAAFQQGQPGHQSHQGQQGFQGPGIPQGPAEQAPAAQHGFPDQGAQPGLRPQEAPSGAHGQPQHSRGLPALPPAQSGTQGPAVPQGPAAPMVPEGHGGGYPSENHLQSAATTAYPAQPSEGHAPAYAPPAGEGHAPAYPQAGEGHGPTYPQAGEGHAPAAYAPQAGDQGYGAQPPVYNPAPAQPSLPPQTPAAPAEQPYTPGPYVAADVQPAATPYEQPAATPYERPAAPYEPHAPYAAQADQTRPPAYGEPQPPGYDRQPAESGMGGYAPQAEQQTPFYTPPQETYPPQEGYSPPAEAGAHTAFDGRPQQSFPQPPENYGQPLTGYSGGEFAWQTEQGTPYQAPAPVDPRSQQIAQAYQQAESYAQQAESYAQQAQGTEPQLRVPEYMSSPGSPGPQTGGYDDPFGHPQAPQGPPAAQPYQQQGGQQGGGQWDAHEESTMRLTPGAYQGDPLNDPDPGLRPWDSRPTIDPTAIYKPERSAQVTGEESTDRERVGPGQEQNMSWYGSDRREH
ncbi:hypothetical protein ACFFR2_13770 [Streptosporangium nondiastaticum]|uniref:hypothetical protein n=1 Tax=Streptosporangium nondiastaticum TaxID=35764 RepID=UPI0035EB9285